MIIEFEYSGAGGHTITIQWYRDDGVIVEDGDHDGVIISGATTTQLEILNGNPEWSGDYYAIVTDETSDCEVETDPVEVEFPDLCVLEITTQPESQEITEGDTLTLTVVASGEVGSLQYQWYRDGVALFDGPSGGSFISGVNTDTLEITTLEAALAGDYTVVVTDDGLPDCSVTSDEAVVSALERYPLSIINACGAYSFARLLREDYGGPAFQVRRSSDNSFLDIGFVDGEVDTAALLTFVGAGSGYVNILYDQSSCGNSLTIIDTDQQPAVVIAGVLQVDDNGVPWGLFDGGPPAFGDSLSGSTPNTSPTYICVFQVKTHVDGTVLVSGSQQNFTGVRLTGGDKIGMDSGALSAGPSYIVDQQYVVTAFFDVSTPANDTIQLNDGIVTTLNPGAAGNGSFLTLSSVNFSIHAGISELYSVQGQVPSIDLAALKVNLNGYYQLY